MLEKAFFVAEYDSVNRNGVSGSCYLLNSSVISLVGNHDVLPDMNRTSSCMSKHQTTLFLAGNFINVNLMYTKYGIIQVST